MTTSTATPTTTRQHVGDHHQDLGCGESPRQGPILDRATTTILCYEFSSFLPHQWSLLTPSAPCSKPPSWHTAQIIVVHRYSTFYILHFRHRLKLNLVVHQLTNHILYLHCIVIDNDPIDVDISMLFSTYSTLFVADSPALLQKKNAFYTSSLRLPSLATESIKELYLESLNHLWRP